MAETLLAFDFGERRIGVAVGNTLLRSARALETIEATTTVARFSRIAELIGQWQPDRLVVGRPLDVDGTPHETTRRAERFANQLHGRFNLPVAQVDERYSSQEGDALHRSLRQANLARREKTTDHYAAEVILQRFFEDPPNGHSLT